MSGVMVVLVSVATAAAAGYFGLKLAQIDRVRNIRIAGAAAGEPANYLIVGTDSRKGLDPDAAGLSDDGETGCDCTDTIMVLRVDPAATSAHVLSFPRDLWLPIAGTDRSARINSAHAKGEQVLIDTIEESFGIEINHYVEIDFVGFERLVNAVGGIPMWFDNPVRDQHTGLNIPNRACQVLDGEQARKFVRSRYLEYKGDDGRWRADATSDLGRITRQQAFIRQAISKAVGAGLTNPATLNQLVSAGVENVRLDSHLKVGTILDVGRKFASFDAKDLIGYSIPAVGFRTSRGAAVLRPQMREAEEMLNIFRGLPPGTISSPSVDVRVLNGTGIVGQAGDVAEALEVLGFVTIGVGSYPERVQHTRVLYGDGGDSAARLVARHLTGGAPLYYDDSLEGNEVVVVTGADFTTVHEQIAPEGSRDELRSTTTTVAPPSTVAGETTTSTVAAPPTTAKPAGYATGEPPPGETCG